MILISDYKYKGLMDYPGFMQEEDYKELLKKRTRRNQKELITSMKVKNHINWVNF